MQDTNNSSQDPQLLLNIIGGEPLDGSGFETEEADPQFESSEEK